MGGPPGDPKDGYRRPCGNEPAYIVKEKEPGSDGLHGEMSICSSCWPDFLGGFNIDNFHVTDIQRELAIQAGEKDLEKPESKILGVSNCPRDLHSLRKLKDGVLFRLSMQLKAFEEADDEQVFLTLTREEKAKKLHGWLKAYDDKWK